MRYKYMMTSRVSAEVEDLRLGRDTKQKLRHDLESTTKCDDTWLGTTANMWVTKIHANSGPRFVWFQRHRDDIGVCIYVLRHVFDSHDDYKHELNEVTKQGWANKHALNLEEESEVEEMFRQLTPKTERELLPPKYLKYEERPRRFEETRDVIVYELPEWVDGYMRMEDRYIQQLWQELYDMFVEPEKHPEKFFTETQEGCLLIHHFSGIEFCYREEVNTSGDNALKAIYLLQVGQKVDTVDLLDKKYDGSWQSLRQKSAKCYPQFILIDDSTWIAVENDNDANLALSGEELKILQNIEYPFFVTGLAGSGKSTILYYLFAHAFDYEETNCPDHHLLFLSYSRKLVNNAMRIVRSILSHHPAYDMKSKFLDKEFERRFERCFRPFQDFIREDFLDQEEGRRFSRDKYIDYQRFKELYGRCKLPLRKRYSSDIVWSVIRTFIKGKDGSSYFTPKDYSNEQLGQRDHTVTSVDYANIYSLWNSWYRKFFDDEKGWDDLDLVRYSLKVHSGENGSHEYAVVFCDEAQDFTRVETDLIISLSVHSRYDLTKQEGAEKIPIAFAGDPNQTVNPTGFRWGSTQDIFNQAFSESLGTFQGFKPQILHINYRSREGIVKFANTIQYLRHEALSDGRESFSPQEAWIGEDNQSRKATTGAESVSYVAFYSLDQCPHYTLFEGMNKSDAVITADEGEYTVVDEDSQQRNGKNKTEVNAQQQYTRDRKNALALNDLREDSRLYTAITSKGLEFKSVILYRFSDDPAVDLFQKIARGEKLTNESELYNLSHFFTKLYIAVSRAKEILFILDTDEGYEKLWKYFVKGDQWENLLKVMQPDEKHLPYFGSLERGALEEYTRRLDKNFNPKEYAEWLFKNAIDEGNAETMRRARSAFKEAKLSDKATLCEAYIFEFTGKSKEAGDSFRSLGQYQNAVDAYWEGQCWDGLRETLPMLTGSDNEDNAVKRELAQFMTDRHATVTKFFETWASHEYQFQENINNGANRDIWTNVLQEVEAMAEDLQPKDITASLLEKMDYLDIYFSWYKKGMRELRADLHFKRAKHVNRLKDKADPDFRTEDLQAAISIWEENGTSNTNDYFRAKKLVADNPSEEVKWMMRLGQGNEVLEKYGDKSLAASLPEDVQAQVFTLLLGGNRDYDKAIEYPYPKDLHEKWRRLYMANKGRFLLNIVLTNFTIEKFSFLQDNIQHEEEGETVFDQKLPTSIFGEIFSLTETDTAGRPYWLYFVSDLKNAEGHRAFFSFTDNRPQIAEALADTLKKRDDKTQASCLIETLFGSDFNQDRVEKFLPILAKIFSANMFAKEDFRGSAKRNRYFLWCNLTDDEYNRMKDDLRQWVDHHLNGMRKAGKNDLAELKALFHAYEIAVPYQGTLPDYAFLVRMYVKRRKESKLDVLALWLNGRLALNQLFDDYQLQKSSFSKFRSALEASHTSFKDTLEAFNREDAIMFIVATSTGWEEYSQDSIMTAAWLIYTQRLNRGQFMPYCHVNDLAKYLLNAVDIAIDEILAADRIDEYRLKLLSYVYEAFSYTAAATNYNKLAARKRLVGLTVLTGYLRRRALLCYSHVGTASFKAKQDEYGIMVDRRDLEEYPKIELHKDEVNYDVTSRRKETEQPTSDKTRTQTAETKGKRSRKTKESKPTKPQLGAFDIARNLKNMGMPPEKIQQATGIALGEIEKL